MGVSGVSSGAALAQWRSGAFVVRTRVRSLVRCVGAFVRWNVFVRWDALIRPHLPPIHSVQTSQQLLRSDLHLSRVRSYAHSFVGWLRWLVALVRSFVGTLGSANPSARAV